MATKLVVLHPNIPDVDVLFSSLANDVSCIIYNANLETGKLPNLKELFKGETQVALVWNNAWQKQEIPFEGFEEALHDDLVVDLITCNLNSSEFTEQMKTLEALHNNLQIRYSLDKTGNPENGGDWVMESHDVSIKELYFSEGVNAYTKTLDINSVVDGTLVAQVIVNGGTGAGTYDASGSSLYNGDVLLTTTILQESGVTYSLTIQYDISSIGVSAFYKCTGLTSVTIPNNITSIGNQAFILCSGLNSIVIPDSVITIGDNAFYKCTSLTSLVIPDSVTSIGGYAFYHCYSLTSLVIPDSVISIGDFAFNSCYNVTSLVLHSSLVNVGSLVFSNLASGNKFVTINNDALYSSDTTIIRLNLTTPPSNLDLINVDFTNADLSGINLENADLTNTNLTNADLTNANLTNANIFNADLTNANLTGANIEDTISTINLSSLNGTIVSHIDISGGSISGTYTSDDINVFHIYNKNLIRTSLVDAYTTTIGTLVGTTYEIEISNSVISIEYNAFIDCSGLTSLVIPNSVTTIGVSAFQSCSGLTSLVIPNSVTSIGDSAFQSCSSLTSLVIPDSVTIIGASVFKSCSSLTSVVIPDSVTIIGLSAFQSCSGLTSVVIPDSVTTIENSAFDSCISIESVVVHNSLVNIGSSVFSNLASGNKFVTINNDVLYSSNTSIIRLNLETPPSNLDLTNVDFTNADLSGINLVDADLTNANLTNANLTGANIFNTDLTNANLTGANIEDTIKYINLSSLDGTIVSNIDICGGLISGTYSTDNSNVYYIYNKNLIRTNLVDAYTTTVGTLVGATYEVEISNIVISIEDNAFIDCSGLTSIVIPDSVTSIGNSAFQNCSGLTSIIISDSVTTIGDNTFNGCSGLSSIVIPDSVTTIGLSAFSNLASGHKFVTINNDALYSSNTTIIRLNLETPPSNLDLTNVDFTNADLSGINLVDANLTNANLTNANLTNANIFNANLTNANLIGANIEDTIKYINLLSLDGTILSHIDISASSISGTYTTDNSNIYHIYNKNLIRTNLVDGYTTTVGTLVEATYEVEISNIVISIEDNAFIDCSGLTSVVIPDSVTTIGVSAFQNCSGLTSLVIPNSVTTIGDNTFNGCSGLTSIVIPDSVTTIGSSAFSNLASGYKFVTINNNALSNPYISMIRLNLETPPSHLDLTNVDFTNADLSGINLTNANLTNTNLTNANLTNANLTNANLTNANLTNANLTGANIDGPTISHIDISGGSISGTYTSDDTNIYHIFNENLIRTNIIDVFTTTVGTLVGATYEVEISNIVISIKDYAFSNCSGLTSIVIPNSVTTIGNSAFQSCTGLTSVVIPDSVITIGDSVFHSCTGLTSVVIPDSVTTIGDSAFRYCTSIQSVVVHNSLVNTGLSAFSNLASGHKFVTINNDSLYDTNTTIIRLNLETPPSNLDLTNVDFTNADLSGINLVDANLTNANLTNANLTGANIFNANLTNANLTGANIEDTIKYINLLSLDGTILSHIDISASSISGTYTTDNSNIYHIYNKNLIRTNLVDGYTTTVGTLVGTTYEVEISNIVISIEDNAFIDCSGLTSIVIPDSVTSIGNSAFSNCSGLTSIVIPDSVTSIGTNTFNGCSSIESVVVHNSLVNTGLSAFSNLASGHKFVTINNNALYSSNTTIIRLNLTTPPSNLDLTNVDFTNADLSGINLVDANLTNANLTNANLTNANLTLANLTNASLTNTILDGAIGYGVSLSSLDGTIISHIDISGGDIFGTYTTNDTNVYHIFNKNLLRLSILDGVTTTVGTLVGATYEVEISNIVISIEDNAFIDCSGLTSLVIPDSVTTIGVSAFQNCSGLTSLVIPDSVTTIGDNTFNGCSGLTSIVIPDSVTTIGSSVFTNTNPETKVVTINNDDLYSLDTTIIRLNLTTPPSNLDLTNVDFTNIDLSGINLVGADLTNANLTNANLSGGNLLFTNLSGANLTNTNLSNTITINNFQPVISIIRISGGDISGTYTTDNEYIYNISNNNLLRTSIVDGITDIVGTLVGTTYEVEISNIVISIEDNAFIDCSGLTSIVIPDSVTSIGVSAFQNCSGLTSIVIPDSVTSIGVSAFQNCSGLTSVVIAGSITTINKYTFMDCTSLTSVSLPDSLILLDNQVFYNCSSLQTIIGYKNLLYIKEDTFTGTASNFKFIAVNIIGINDYTFITLVKLSSTEPPSNLDLTNMNFKNAQLSSINLEGANLTGSDLTSSNLIGADLSGADLSGANLTNAILISADLTNANLTNVTLTGIILTGTILTGAILTNVEYEDVDSLYVLSNPLQDTPQYSVDSSQYNSIVFNQEFSLVLLDDDGDSIDVIASFILGKSREKTYGTEGNSYMRWYFINNPTLLEYNNTNSTTFNDTDNYPPYYVIKDNSKYIDTDRVLWISDDNSIKITGIFMFPSVNPLYNVDIGFSIELTNGVVYITQDFTELSNLLITSSEEIPDTKMSYTDGTLGKIPFVINERKCATISVINPSNNTVSITDEGNYLRLDNQSGYIKGVNYYAVVHKDLWSNDVSQNYPEFLLRNLNNKDSFIFSTIGSREYILDNRNIPQDDIIGTTYTTEVLEFKTDGYSSFYINIYSNNTLQWSFKNSSLINDISNGIPAEFITHNPTGGIMKITINTSNVEILETQDLPRNLMDYYKLALTTNDHMQITIDTEKQNLFISQEILFGMNTIDTFEISLNSIEYNETNIIPNIYTGIYKENITISEIIVKYIEGLSENSQLIWNDTNTNNLVCKFTVVQSIYVSNIVELFINIVKRNHRFIVEVLLEAPGIIDDSNIKRYEFVLQPHILEDISGVTYLMDYTNPNNSYMKLHISDTIVPIYSNLPSEGFKISASTNNTSNYRWYYPAHFYKYKPISKFSTLYNNTVNIYMNSVNLFKTNITNSDFKVYYPQYYVSYSFIDLYETMYYKDAIGYVDINGNNVMYVLFEPLYSSDDSQEKYWYDGLYEYNGKQYYGILRNLLVYPINEESNEIELFNISGDIVNKTTYYMTSTLENIQVTYDTSYVNLLDSNVVDEDNTLETSINLKTYIETNNLKSMSCVLGVLKTTNSTKNKIYENTVKYYCNLISSQLKTELESLVDISLIYTYTFIDASSIEHTYYSFYDDVEVFDVWEHIEETIYENTVVEYSADILSLKPIYITGYAYGLDNEKYINTINENNTSYAFLCYPVNNPSVTIGEIYSHIGVSFEDISKNGTYNSSDKLHKVVFIEDNPVVGRVKIYGPFYTTGIITNRYYLEEYELGYTPYEEEEIDDYIIYWELDSEGNRTGNVISPGELELIGKRSVERESEKVLHLKTPSRIIQGYTKTREHKSYYPIYQSSVDTLYQSNSIHEQLISGFNIEFTQIDFKNKTDGSYDTFNVSTHTELTTYVDVNTLMNNSYIPQYFVEIYSINEINNINKSSSSKDNEYEYEYDYNSFKTLYGTNYIMYNFGELEQKTIVNQVYNNQLYKTSLRTKNALLITQQIAEKLYALDRGSFSALDTDGNNVLTSSEGELVRILLKEADFNKDNQIDFNEYMGWLSAKSQLYYTATKENNVHILEFSMKSNVFDSPSNIYMAVSEDYINSNRDVKLYSRYNNNYVNINISFGDINLPKSHIRINTKRYIALTNDGYVYPLYSENDSDRQEYDIEYNTSNRLPISQTYYSDSTTDLDGSMKLPEYSYGNLYIVDGSDNQVSVIRSNTIKELRPRIVLSSLTVTYKDIFNNSRTITFGNNGDPENFVITWKYAPKTLFLNKKENGERNVIIGNYRNIPIEYNIYTKHDFGSYYIVLEKPNLNNVNGIDRVEIGPIYYNTLRNAENNPGLVNINNMKIIFYDINNISNRIRELYRGYGTLNINNVIVNLRNIRYINKIPYQIYGEYIHPETMKTNKGIIYPIYDEIEGTSDENLTIDITYSDTSDNTITKTFYMPKETVNTIQLDEERQYYGYTKHPTIEFYPSSTTIDTVYVCGQIKGGVQRGYFYNLYNENVTGTLNRLELSAFDDTTHTLFYDRTLYTGSVKYENIVQELNENFLDRIPSVYYGNGEEGYGYYYPLIEETTDVYPTREVLLISQDGTETVTKYTSQNVSYKLAKYTPPDISLDFINESYGIPTFDVKKEYSMYSELITILGYSTTSEIRRQIYDYLTSFRINYSSDNKTIDLSNLLYFNNNNIVLNDNNTKKFLFILGNILNLYNIVDLVINFNNTYITSIIDNIIINKYGSDTTIKSNYIIETHIIHNNVIKNINTELSSIDKIKLNVFISDEYSVSYSINSLSSATLRYDMNDYTIKLITL